ncbi:hypothetical protein [Clostridium beijerinckii]|uniref:Peptidase M4 C-terminal domain-containing protein n=1 Tax=Clostridium beijerinckii TaxID=1520 RepID=A0AAX0AW34_CLOBE|nr:hypothetical protein [Clostridium beijerinckii]NRT87280.1 hypothetical protein [Clostridium beijerinckii]NYC72711.1 hypothetical protein [Clostridium beijerinckii]
MSKFLDEKARESGTRFLIYPQNKNLIGFEKPEVVYINLVPGSIKAGPEDDKMYVVDAKNKHEYMYEFEGPPYKGPRFPAVEPDKEGHFDYIDPSSREFSSTIMYATVRRVLEIWEDYFGHSIEWYFREKFPRLELIPRVEWDNAHSGYGFVEFGFGRTLDNRHIDHDNPYCENFDVLAHEIGHTIKNSIIGIPNKNEYTPEYSGHHEAFGDLVAIVSVLHFDSVVDHILNNTKGNLFSVNELSRMGELSQSREIRMAFNDKKMSDVGAEEHDLSEPFTGGAFDILVEIFERNLIERVLISEDLGKRSYHAKGENELKNIQNEFEEHYRGKENEFKEALLDARDYFGKLMAKAWSNITPNKLTYGKVLNNIIKADQELSGGKYKETILDCFDWREIMPSSDNSRTLLSTHIVDELNEENELVLV